MKKRFSRRLALLLAAVLMFTGAGITTLAENMPALLGEPEKAQIRYMVHFDPWGDPAEAHVKADGEEVFNYDETDKTVYYATASEAVRFELKQPEARKGERPVVEVSVWQDGDQEPFQVYRSDWQGEGNLRLVYSDTEGTWSFDFAPDAGLNETNHMDILILGWSEFDAFGPFEGESMIQVNPICDGRYFVDGEPVRQMSLGMERKLIFAEGSQPKLLAEPSATMIMVDHLDETREWYFKGDPVPEAEDPKDIEELWDGEQEMYVYAFPKLGEFQDFYVELNFNYVPAPEQAEEAKEAVEAHPYAYFDEETDPELFRSFLGTEILSEFFIPDRPYYGVFGVLGNGIWEEQRPIPEKWRTPDRQYYTVYVCEGLMSALTISDPKDPDETGLPYREYSLALGDQLKAEGRAYILNSTTQFVLKTSDATGNEKFTVLDSAAVSGEGEDHDLYAYVPGPDFDVFGNGTCIVGGLETHGESLWAFHITQEHSRLYYDEHIGGIGLRLICAKGSEEEKLEAVAVKSDVTAAAWGFINIPAYVTSAERGEGEPAELYYGNDGTEGRKFTFHAVKQSGGETFGKIISDIVVDTDVVPAGIAEVMSSGEGAEKTFSIAFHSNYDEVPLVITYADGTVGYLTIKRVGLSISGIEKGRDEAGQIRVWHGTDQWEDYECGDEMAVAGSFYYRTGSVKPAEEDHVSLFVTVTMIGGKKESYKIDGHLNEDYIQTTGNDEYCDDFLLWSGSRGDYGKIAKIEAIVMGPTTDEDSFGGVMVGSGAGVEWIPEDIEF